MFGSEINERRDQPAGARNLSEDRSGLTQPLLHRLRRLFNWTWRTDEDQGGDDRALLVQILVAVVWLPIQLILSLLFATGGMFLLLILGMVLAPFIGVFFLIRHLVRSTGSDHREPINSEDRPARPDS